jgi:hypothetical protein
MIIFANVLLDKQIITSETFTALLLMAVASTMLTVPVVTPTVELTAPRWPARPIRPAKARGSSRGWTAERALALARRRCAARGGAGAFAAGRPAGVDEGLVRHRRPDHLRRLGAAARCTGRAANAPVVDRLLAAGAVIVGRTNMTEFAFSGLGMNPHHGTPRNPVGSRHAAASRGVFSRVRRCR